MYRIELLPAEWGDCIWIEYGDGGAMHRVLIDCGTPGTWPTLRARLLALPEAQRRFDLMVITHIDADHIGGTVELMNEMKQVGARFDDIWFNGWKHLVAVSDTLGSKQGEKVSDALVKLKLPWNRKFAGNTVYVPDSGPLPRKTLRGGMEITLLSPYAANLSKLIPAWKKELEKEGLVPGEGIAERRSKKRTDLLGARLDVDKLAATRFKTDAAPANGSSIAFLARYDGKTALFGADAYAGVLQRSLARLSPTAVALDAFKLPHHGSKNNVSTELIQAVRCKRFFLSSDGRKFGHPDPEAVARVIKGSKSPTLYFNYSSAQNQSWADRDAKRQHGYSTRYPSASASGLSIDL